MVRLIPYLICFGFGFFVAMMLFNRGGNADSTEWKEKYHDLSRRFRELSRRLSEPETGPGAPPDDGTSRHKKSAE